MAKKHTKGDSDNPEFKESGENMKKPTGVFTQEDLKGEEEKSSSSKKSKTTKKKKEDPIKDVIFECGFAPAGKSTIAFLHTYLGKQYSYNLELDNKRFVFPKDTDKKDIKRYREALKANGFVDITVLNEAQHDYDAQKGEYIYRVIHPEHTEKNRINGSLSLVLLNDSGRPVFYEDEENKGKQIYEQVMIIDGIAKTSNPKVLKALLKAGFVDAGKIRKEE